MEVLINELSLHGQYQSENHFVETGATPFVAVLKELNNSRDVVYKKYDLYSYHITQELSLFNFLTSQTARITDITRRLKSLLSGFILDEPYWEDSQKHSLDSSYIFNNENVVTSSLAEACERDRVIISFKSDKFNTNEIKINKDDSEQITLNNFFYKGHCNELNRKNNYINIDEYCVTRFKGDKLDFSQIDNKLGFALLKKEDEDLFIDAFRKFTELSWQQINVDDALDYKPYPDNDKVFKNIPYKIHKFRVTQKYRCFGYTIDGIYYVLRFDLEHKLSD